MWTSGAFLTLCLSFPTPPHTLCHCWCFPVERLRQPFPLEVGIPEALQAATPLLLARDMERHLRDSRDPLAVVATSRTMTAVGKAGWCLQPELQNRMGKWGQVRYPAPSPGTSRRGSYLRAGCQTASWGPGVAGSHGGNRRKWLWGAQTQGPTPSTLLLRYLLTLLLKRIKEWQNLYASEVTLIPHLQYKFNLD